MKTGTTTSATKRRHTRTRVEQFAVEIRKLYNRELLDNCPSGADERPAIITDFVQALQRVQLDLQKQEGH